MYPVRPFMCRLFGHSPAMVCDRGHNVNIPQKKEQRLMAQYVASKPDVWLHGVVYDEADMLHLIANDPEESA